MITTFYPPYSFGGDASFVQHLTNALASRGHTVDVIHCMDSYLSLGGVAPAKVEPPPPNVRVHGISSGLGTLSPLATHQTGFPIGKRGQLRALLDRPYDVIHYHNISLIGGPAILGYGRGLKLYTWHEYWLVCPTNLLFRDGREPCWEPRCTLCSLRQRRPPQLWRATSLLADSLGSIDAFLSPSRFAIARHQALNLKAPVIHLPNFVPDAPVLPATPSAAPYFLYAGRLEPAKGLGTLLDLFQHWPDARLVVAGTGSEKEAVHRAASAHDNIEYAGHVSQERLRLLYRNAVAVIVPSLTFELFPLVVLEAFRDGTPVVVRNQGSLPEIIEDSGGGLTYDNNEALRTQCRRLLENPELRQDHGNRGRRAFETLWQAERHLDRYLGLIEELQAQSR